MLSGLLTNGDEDKAFQVYLGYAIIQILTVGVVFKLFIEGALKNTANPLKKRGCKYRFGIVILILSIILSLLGIVLISRKTEVN